MSGAIESATIALTTGNMFDETLAIIVAVKTEIVLFFLALLIHQLLWGGKVVKKKCRGGKQLDAALEGHRTLSRDTLADSPSDGQTLCLSQQAYDCGDHRAVIRLWNSLRRCDQIPATHLAQVVETMQRMKKDSSEIVAEVQGYFRRNKSACHSAYFNQLFAMAAKSLDIELVNGLFELMSSLGIRGDCHTYEMLMQMHFTTRNFNELRQLCDEMEAKQLVPTARASLILLKAALRAGNLDESIKRFQGLFSEMEVPTASQAPKHVMVQLVELACQQRRLEVLLASVDSARMPFSAEMVDTVLAESARLKDRSLAEHVKQLAISQGIELNSRSYQHLIFGAGDNVEEISQLLTEMQEKGVECLPDVVTTVLSVCTSMHDVKIASQLYELVSNQQARNVPVFVAFVCFYANAGHAEKACTMYDEHSKLQKGDSSEWRRSNLDSKTEKCLLSAAMQCGRKDIIADLVVSSPADTANHITMIRNSASKGNLAEAMKIFHSLETSGAVLTTSLYNALLDACVVCRDMAQAENLMKRMTAAEQIDAVSYNTLIKAHLLHENLQAARSVMDTMRKAGCVPNLVTYNELINALVRSDREMHRSQVWDVLEEMKVNDVCPNKITCSILFRSLKSRSPQADVVRIMELADRMQEPMDEVLLSSIIEACVRIGKPELLTAKLEQLQGKNGIKVTGAHTFGSLIKAYGAAKDMDGAWRCWKTMRSQHIKPTSITIGCMIEAVVSNGDADGGYELISELLQDPKCRSQVNAVIFGSVLKGFGRTKQMDRVWAVFKEMLSLGIEPSVSTYNAVINACVSNNDINAIEGLLADIKTRGIKPNLITYSTIIKGLCQAGDMSAAFAVLKDLKNANGVNPDEIVYNTLLDGCATAGLVAEGEQLLVDMQKDGLAPTNYTLTVLVKLMGQGRCLERAFEIIDVFSRKHRIRANSHVYSALIQGCLTCRDFTRASEAFEQSLRCRVQPDARVCQSFMRTFITNGKASRAVGLFHTLLSLAAPRSGSGCAPIDDTFINDVVSCLLEAGTEARALAPALVADIRVARPKLRLDPAIDRNLALTVVRQHGAEDAAPKKSHPWTRK